MTEGLECALCGSPVTEETDPHIKRTDAEPGQCPVCGARYVREDSPIGGQPGKCGSCLFWKRDEHEQPHHEPHEGDCRQWPATLIWYRTIQWQYRRTGARFTCEHYTRHDAGD